MNPRDYNLPHSEWRPGQEDTLNWCLDLDGLGIVDAPTGSGKTSYAAACAYEKGAIALCKTKNLQAENYGQMYSFKVLFGKGNYRCIHPENRGATCAECLFVDRESGKGMSDCNFSRDCYYLNAKYKALNARKTSLNYAYWLSSYGIRQRDRDYLFLDECHQLSDLVLEWSGCTVSQTERSEWGLPQFPIAGTKGDQNTGKGKVVDWLMESTTILNGILSELQPTDHWGIPLEPNATQRKLLTKCENLIRKLQGTLEALDYGVDDWFMQSGPLAVTRGPGLLVKPLTARFHFPRFFPSGNGGEIDAKFPKCVLMSATVGNPEIFAAELGIENFTSRQVPNQWPAEHRPIYVLDTPKMGRKSTEEDYEHQADAIAQAILTVPHNWSGIIHVTRKREAPLLASRLADRGLQDRVWIPKQSSTNQMAKQWEQRKRKVPGSLVVSWAMWEGYDGLEERINVTAKVPFPFLGSPYEKARQRRSGSFYLQRAAWGLQQSQGRNRRGRECDYDTSTERRGLNLIADANWEKLAGRGRGKQYLSNDFLEAIRKWQ